MDGVGTFGVFACVQEMAVSPGELLAGADLIHYTVGVPRRIGRRPTAEDRGQRTEGRARRGG